MSVLLGRCLHDEPVSQSLWTVLVGVRGNSADHRCRVEVPLTFRRAADVFRHQKHFLLNVDDHQQTGSKVVIVVSDFRRMRRNTGSGFKSPERGGKRDDCRGTCTRQQR